MTWCHREVSECKDTLDQLFEPECRPSLRWLRSMTTAKAIPHIRLGRLIFYSVEMVRDALAAKNVIMGRREMSMSPRKVA